MNLLQRLGCGIAAAALPFPDRRPYERWVDAPLWSFAIGMAELGLGLVLLLEDAHGFYVEHNALIREAVFAADPSTFDDEGARLALMWSGMFTWAAWAVRPLVWFLGSVVLVGFIRLVTFAVSREVFGEPLVWVGVRFVGKVKRRLDVSAATVRRGPEREDRFVRERDAVTLLTYREQPGWHELATIEIEGRFFRLDGVEEREDGAWKALAYRLVEEPAIAAIRSLVRYSGGGRLPAQPPGGE